MGVRKNPRYQSTGQVYIAEVPNTEALLKNLSVSGLCIESPEFMELAPNTHYSVEVVPEEDSKLAKFSLDLETKWVRAKTQKFESGFVIVVPPGTPGTALLEQYLSYLARQGKALDDN